MSDDKMPQAKDVKEILDVVSEKVPELLEKVTNAIYGAENAKKFAAAVAEFYKSLKAAGMTDEQAYELTKEYMSSLNIGGLVGKAFQGHGPKGKHDYVVYTGDEDEDKECDECDEDDEEDDKKK